MSRLGSRPEGALRPLAIEAGSLADALFLVRQVERGAHSGNFSPRMLRPLDQFLLLRRCCLAMLRGALPGLLGPRGDRFVALRCADTPVAAMLINTVRDRDGGHIVGIDYLVVAQDWQRQGLGRLLLRRAIEQAPPRSGFVCFCAPQSKAMKRLLLSFGFRREVRAAPLGGMVMPHAYALTPPGALYSSGKPATTWASSTLPSLPSFSASHSGSSVK